MHLDSACVGGSLFTVGVEDADEWNDWLSPIDGCIGIEICADPGIGGASFTSSGFVAESLFTAGVEDADEWDDWLSPIDGCIGIEIGADPGIGGAAAGNTWLKSKLKNKSLVV